MGRFIYESRATAEFDDRTLAHLQFIVEDKLRRGEPFAFGWQDDASLGAGRTVVWISPESSLIFKYYGSRTPPLNRRWLEELAQVASSRSGLHVVPEPEAPDSATLRDDD